MTLVAICARRVVFPSTDLLRRVADAMHKLAVLAEHCRGDVYHHRNRRADCQERNELRPLPVYQELQ